MTYMIIAGFLALIACGISAAHHHEREVEGMQVYMRNEYPMAFAH